MNFTHINHEKVMIQTPFPTPHKSLPPPQILTNHRKTHPKNHDSHKTQK